MMLPDFWTDLVLLCLMFFGRSLAESILTQPLVSPGPRSQSAGTALTPVQAGQIRFKLGIGAGAGGEMRSSRLPPAKAGLIVYPRNG